jgi:hypothetical protein
MRRSLLLTLAALLVAASTVMAAPVQKVLVCHVPPDDPANAHTISVASSAVPAHLAHGDYEGNCTSGAIAVLCKCYFDFNNPVLMCDYAPTDCSQAELILRCGGDDLCGDVFFEAACGDVSSCNY